ncbi:MAG: GH25 family lysozyme [Verrucomicrobiota bacterium]
MKRLLVLMMAPLLCQCGGGAKSGGVNTPRISGGGFGGTSISRSPTVVNVSGWDPKERQRGGHGYNQNDVSALKANGAHGLIARSAKGPLLDDKFADFLKSADRAGMLLGAYHFVTMDQSPEHQAESFVRRVRAIATAKSISQRRILLVGDFDTHSTPDRIVRFNRRVRELSGVVPVVYLENSAALRARMRDASPAVKLEIRRAPYWIALYSPAGTERSMGRELTPDGLMEEYGVWRSWSMWQYGGVIWQNGGSRPKHYDTSRWGSPQYFGDLAMPLERNVFRGSAADLHQFWQRHGFAWWS